MEREQDSIIMDAATRRNLEINENLAGGAEIRWLLCSTAPSRRWAAVC
ncbi:hypothetical protein ACLK14_15295 [Escherichia coli]